MRTTIDFLDALKERHGLTSDYAVAKKLGITTAAVSKWRNGKDYLGDTTAIRVGNLLEIDPAYVVACAHAERAKQDAEKALWQGLAARLLPAGASRICIMLSRQKKKTSSFDDLSLFGQLSALA